MMKILNALKNSNGVFARAFELNSPRSPAEIYVTGFDELRIKRHETSTGIARDKANFLRDRYHLASDLRKSMKAAKENIGV